MQKCLAVTHNNNNDIHDIISEIGRQMADIPCCKNSKQLRAKRKVIYTFILVRGEAQFRNLYRDSKPQHAYQSPMSKIYDNICKEFGIERKKRQRDNNNNNK